MGYFLRYSFLFLFITSVTFIAPGNDFKVDLNGHRNISTIKADELADLSAQITGKTSFCKNTQSAEITFEGSGGKAPYTFTYQIDGSTQPPISTIGSSNTVQVTVNTANVKDITYKITNLKDVDGIEKTLDVSKTISVKDLPVASFEFKDDNVCSGSIIQFTSTSTGAEPLKYTWEFGDKETSTVKNPTHSFISLGCDIGKFKVKLTITDANGCISSVEKEITVKQKPDIGFTDLKNQFNPFSNCGNASISNPNFNVEVKNISKSNCITSFSLDWGDGSSIENNVNFPIPHTYTKLGAFNLVITAKGNNGCDNSITYVVKNVTNPSVGVTSPGTTTNLCAPTDELKFEIAKWGNNSPGTKYDVDYGDGTPILTLNQEDLEKSTYFNSSEPASSQNYPIPHSYKISNCPSKEFIVTVIAYNVCSSTTGTVNNITVLTKPQPDFENSPACLNTVMKFTNKTIGGYNPNCDTYAEYIWDFGDGTSSNQVGDVSHTYKSPGQFTVTLSTKNYCGVASKTKQITINPLPTATIEGGATVCKDAPSPEITFIGTTGMAPFVFTYRINTGSNQTIKTTSGNNVKLQVPTNNPGKFTYTLISVQDANGCAQNQGGDAVFEVKSAPTATISGTQNVCQNTSYPNVTFTGNGGTVPYTFTYNIDGGANKTISTTSGNSVSIQVPTENVGVFKYNLLGVTDASASACTSTQTGIATITINQPPAVMTLENQEFCNGVATPVISFTNTVAGTTYSWTNSNSSIGLAASGTGNIQSFIAKNSTSGPITSTIEVTPKANGCSGATQTFTITVNPAAGVIFTPGNQTICSGENTQAVQLSSNTAGATFSWTAVQPADITGVVLSGTDVIPVQTLSNNSSAPVTVTYKAKATISGAATCAGADYNYTITVDPRPDINESFKPVVCSNNPFKVSPQNGGINTIPTGTKYTWSLPVISPAGALAGASEQTIPQSEISQTLVNSSMTLASATYTVTPSFNGCTGKTFEIIVSVSPTSIVNLESDITLCNTEQSQEIVFSGTPAGTVFKWSSSNTGIGIQASGVDKIPSFTAINAGTSPLKAIINVIPTFDSGGLICEGAPIQFSITVNPTGQVDNPGSKNMCNGESAGVNFTTKNNGGATIYSWTNSNTAIGLGGSGSGNILFTPVNNENTVLTSTITVTPAFTNNGTSCTGTSEQFTITVNPTPTADQPANQTLCNGVQTNEVQFSGNIPNTVYKWVNSNSSIGLPASGQGNILPFTAKNNTANPLTATITVTPSINGCNGSSKNFTITVNPAGILTIQPVSSTICLGGSPTQLSVAYTNGSGTPAYQWYSNSVNNINGGVKILNATSANFDPPKNVANTTYYYCIISFPAGDCNTLISDIAQVTINPYPVISTINEEISTGETFTVIPNSLNGDVVPAGTTYVWTQAVISPFGSVTGAFAQSSPQTSVSQTLFNSTTGIGTVTYTVTPTSGLCKGTDFKVIVKVSPPMNTNAKVTPIACYGIYIGSIETNIQGGVPISPGNNYITEWTGPNGYISSSANIYNLEPGNYHLKVTDAIGTEYNFDYEITEPKDIIVTTDTKKDVTCFGAENGEITISVTGGMGAFKYTWKKNNIFFSDNQDITNLGPGLYEVAVTDINNCVPKVLTYDITEPTTLAINIIDQTNIECYGDSTGAVSVNVQGGTKIEISPGVFDYKYQWSGPNGFSNGYKDLNNIPAGNYNLTVTDNSGCSLTFSVLIKQSEQIIISPKQKPITCFGANDASIELTISGGVPPYQTQWDNFATGVFQENLSPRDYTVTVTDALGCKKTIVETIVEAGIFNISPVVKHVTCAEANNGSIQLNFIGGLYPISFEWKDDTLAGDTRNNLRPGTYTVNISEGGGCSIADSFIIIEPMPLIITPSIISVFDCNIQNGGAINLSVIGGMPPYKYLWSNGEKTKDISKIPAGDYLVTITDSIGCSITEKFTVNRPPSISVDVIPKFEYCNSDSIKGIYTAVVSGGVPPFEYDWSIGKVIGMNNEMMETNQNGTGFVKVTDASNCTAIETFVMEIPELGISDSLVECNEREYSFNALTANSKEVYSYQWDFGDGTFASQKNLKHIYQNAGIYKVSLKVSNLTNPCISSYEKFIAVEPRPDVKITGKDTICRGESIIIKASGADSYLWAHGPKTDTVLIDSEGIYKVTGFTEAGCNNTDSYSVSFFEPYDYRIESDKLEVTNKDNVVNFSTLYTPNAFYNWDFGDSTRLEGIDLSKPPEHKYYITKDKNFKDGHYNVNLMVINPNNCVEKDSIKIDRTLTSVPNTFTPNNDRHNDYYLEGWNKKIFNRNGVLMFEGKEGWDGTYNGKPVANDTYFVIIYDTSGAGGSSYRTNYVTVLR